MCVCLCVRAFVRACMFVIQGQCLLMDSALLVANWGLLFLGVCSSFHFAIACHVSLLFISVLIFCRSLHRWRDISGVVGKWDRWTFDGYPTNRGQKGCEDQHPQVSDWGKFKSFFQISKHIGRLPVISNSFQCSILSYNDHALTGNTQHMHYYFLR